MSHRLIVLVAFAAACSRPAATPDETPAETPTTEPASATSHAADGSMLRHWVYVTSLRDAIVIGDLDDVRAAANRAAEEPPPTVPVAWMPFTENMRNYTSQVAKAESIGAAAMATSNLAGTCGGCHAATGAQLGLGTGAPPAAGGDIKSHMQRHVWAVNAMWEGLVAPSDGRWLDGAGVLAEKPMQWTDAPTLDATDTRDEEDKANKPEEDGAVKPIEERIHDLGVRAVTAAPAQRAAIYGEFLSTCAECHGKTFAGPE